VALCRTLAAFSASAVRSYLGVAKIIVRRIAVFKCLQSAHIRIRTNSLADTVSMSLLGDATITAAPAHQAPGWSLRVESAVSGRAVKIGGKFSSEDEAAEVASLYRHNGADGYPAAGSMEVGLLQQLCAAAGIAVPDDDVRDIGSARIHPDVATWFCAVVEDDGMVDTFAACHPHARDRFTCWDQSTNRRYINEGSRIDYILIDSALMPYLQKGGQLPGACDVSPHVHAPASNSRAATCC
jgi:hypothetical protein